MWGTVSAALSCCARKTPSLANTTSQYRRVRPSGTQTPSLRAYGRILVGGTSITVQMRKSSCGGLRILAKSRSRSTSSASAAVHSRSSVTSKQSLNLIFLNGGKHASSQAMCDPRQRGQSSRNTSARKRMRCGANTGAASSMWPVCPGHWNSCCRHVAQTSSGVRAPMRASHSMPRDGWPCIKSQSSSPHEQGAFAKASALPGRVTLQRERSKMSPGLRREKDMCLIILVR